MKKHDEGYVLAYVTVVLLLFCLIATMILTGSMKNLTAQQDTIQRMEDRYAAEAMIQKAVALLQNEQSPSDDILYAEDETTEIAKLTAKKLAGAELHDGCKEPDKCKLDEGWKLVATSGTIQITCVVDSNGDYHRFDVSTAPTGEVSG